MTTCKMEIVFAEAGKRMLLMVDKDLRRPTLHDTFRIAYKIGLSNLLLKKGAFWIP